MHGLDADPAHRCGMVSPVPSGMSESPAREILEATSQAASAVLRNGISWARTGRGGQRLLGVVEWIQTRKVPKRVESLLASNPARVVVVKCDEVFTRSNWFLVRPPHVFPKIPPQSQTPPTRRQKLSLGFKLDSTGR